ncbi:dTMP kinase [Candidatus Saccharibacteria bacterium]|nr:dTMP kinase [Candidatus Saccharibacteria bacterium]
MYIVIEGQDGTGKSTQVELMAEYLRSQGREVLTLHEPDGDLESAHALRDIIKQKKYDLEPLTHVLLFTAARNELWRKLAEPVLARGGVVIAARNWWSTLVYQGYGQGVSRSRIVRLTKAMLPEKYVLPDKSVILVLSDEERKKREKGRDAAGGADTTSETDTFESKPDEFQAKLNAGYLKLAKEFNIQTFDASPSISEIHESLKKLFNL